MSVLCKIREIQKATLKIEAQLEMKFGICLNEGMLLCTLCKEGCLTSGTLSEKLSLTLSNTSKVLRSAESKGLIERVLGKEDKRQMYFKITPAGRELLEDIHTFRPEVPPVLECICGNGDMV